MNQKVYFNTLTMARLARKTKTAAGAFLDAEYALGQADRAQTPQQHKAKERLALGCLNYAKDDLLAIVAQIDEAIHLANLELAPKTDDNA